MSKEKYLEILDKFISSVEMREYLVTQELNDRQISDLILGAPVSLETKLKWTTGNEHNEIKQALDELSLNPNEVFYLIDNWYDEDIYDEKEQEYKTGAIKHCFIFANNYRADLSPLYRISKVN